MKLVAESKQVSFPGTAGQKSDAEPFKHIDDQNGVLVHEAKLREEDYVDQILYQTTNDEAATKEDDDSDDMDDLVGNGDVELRRFVEPLPSLLARQMTVCNYEDNSNYVVKDICVDEGLPLHDKFLFDTNMDYDVEYLSTFLSPGKAGNSEEEVVKDSVVELIILEPIVPNASVEGSENAEIRCEEALSEASTNSTGNDASKMSLSLGVSLVLLEAGTDCSGHAPLTDQTSGIQHDSPQDSDPPASKETSSNAAIHEEDITPERHSLDSLPYELTHEVAARLSFDTKFDNSTATATTENIDPQQELKTPISSKIGSKPAPYSGSISMRSDSSTTSTRSFAFPVLQNEWNASPVRMAKADRRHLRKHRRWRQSILCCKF